MTMAIIIIKNSFVFNLRRICLLPYHPIKNQLQASSKANNVPTINISLETNQKQRRQQQQISNLCNYLNQSCRFHRRSTGNSSVSENGKSNNIYGRGCCCWINCYCNSNSKIAIETKQDLQHQQQKQVINLKVSKSTIPITIALTPSTATTTIINGTNLFNRNIYSNFKFNSNIITRHLSSDIPVITIKSTSNRKKMAAALTQDERKEKLNPLLEKGWALVNGRDAIHKAFTFKDFNEAFGLMTRIALLADKMDHHPEWSNVYNKLEITLSSHDVNGLSGRDIKMANFIETIVAK